MKKSILMKFLVLAVCAAMLLSLFACDNDVEPTEQPTEQKTEAPTKAPEPSVEPTDEPSVAPTVEPTDEPTVEPTDEPTDEPTVEPTVEPTEEPTTAPEQPTTAPEVPTDPEQPTQAPEVPTDPEQPTTAPEVPTDPEQPTQAPEVPTNPEQPTQAPEVPTEEKPTQAPEVPTEEKPTQAPEVPTEEKPTQAPEVPTEEKPTEPPTPSCDGNHNFVDKGSQGHYCDKCGKPSKDNMYDHTYGDVDGVYKCTACGYEPDCKGEHAYVSDDTHHWTEKCPVCEAPATEAEAHTGATIDGEYKCTVCGKVLPCPAEHVWVSDAEGHQMAACDVCGAAATDKVPHSEEKVEFLTDTAYGYECKDCGYDLYTKALTDKVAAIITPGNMHYNKADAEKGDLSSSTKYHISTSLDMTAMPYASITHSATDNISQFIWNRHLGDVADRSEHEEYTFSVGQAKYLVIKARATMAETSQIVINLSTAGSDKYNGVIMPLVKAAENAEWVTYVIDLEKAYGDRYALAEGAEDYVVDTFYFNMHPFTTTDVLDVAYMAFVEGEWSDVAANVDEETVIVITASNTGSEVYTETGKCTGEHAYNLAVVDGVYKSICVCGDVKFDYGVKADSVNKFYGAEYFSSHSYGLNGKVDKELIYDETGAFVRYDNAQINKDKWIGFNPITKTSGASGQYMIIKIRVGENGLGQTALNIYVNSTGGQANGLTWDKGSLNFKVSEDGQWHYIVVDLAARVANNAFAQDADGTYNVNYFQVRPFTGHQSIEVQDGQDTDPNKVYTYWYKDAAGQRTKTQTKLTAEELTEKGLTLENITTAKPDVTDYMDISYIAFCDSIDDIKGIVGVDTYEWSVDNSTNSLRNTADNSCAQHAIAEIVDGTTHTIKCTLCGEVTRTFEVSADINWYSPLGGMSNYADKLDKMLFDSEEGVLYNRFSAAGGSGNHIRITGGAGAGAPTADKFPTGKYIVIKYRMESTGTISFSIATGDKKSGNGSGIVAAQAVANMPGMNWRVAIMDVSANAQWTSDGSAQSIYMMMTTGLTYTVDIAYVAVVDSIDEMKTLLQPGETYFDLGNSWNGTPVEYDQTGAKVPCADGKHSIASAVTGTDENGNTTYTYVCSACDTTVQVETVTSAVSKYYTPNAIATDAKQYYSIANNGTKVVTGETGLAYAAMNNYRQLIYMRNNADMGGAQEAAQSQYGTVNVGDAKYAVVKFRSGDANAWMTLSLSTEGKTGTVTVATENMKGVHKPDGSKDTWMDGETEVKGVLAGNEYVSANGYRGINLLTTGAADGEWVTAVIDLEAAYGEYYAKAEGAEDYVIDYFVVDLEGAIDLAYIAFVEGGWTDVDELVDEEKVTYVYGTASESEIRYADGTLYGTKAEDPIDVMFDEYGSATVTVPAKTTMYYSTWMLSGEMSLSANGEPLEFVAGMPRMTPSTFSITNDGEEAMEYYLYAEYPAGHMNNPASLWAGEDNVVEIPAGCQGYFYTYEAYATGTLTLKFSATTGWVYAINNITAGTYGDMQWSDSDPVVDTVVLDVVAGEVYQIMVNTYDPENPWEAPAGTVTVSANLEIPYGSEYNPVQLDELVTKVTVPAGATYYVSTRANGATLFVNGEDKGVITAPNPWTPYTFTVTNETEADAEYTFEVVFPEGTMDNPKDLVLGDNSAEFAEGAEPYYFTWTAEKDGTLTLTISATTGWFYVVNNMTSYVYGDMQWSDSDPVVNPAVVKVKAGDVLEIQVNTYDPENMWSNPAGTVTVAAAFEEAITVVEDLSEINDMEDGTKIQVSGTVVTIDTPWDDYYGNITVTIEDEFGNTFKLFRLSTNVIKGDIITATGVVGSYNDAKQLAQGGTAVITGHDTSYDVGPVEVTIAEALELADGTDVIVTGTVTEVNYAWGGSNMSVTITDDNGDELYIYKLATHVYLGDTITVTGSMATYNGRQIGAGATAVVVTPHECNYSEPTCLAAGKCTACGAEGEAALGHTDADPADGTCDVCGADLEAAASQVTTTLTLDAASRTSFDATTSAVWETEGVKFTNNKGSYNNNLGDYTAPARIYAGTEVVIECTGMTKIVFHVNSGKTVDGLVNGLTDTAAYTVDVDGYTVTVTFAEPADSITFSATAQFRLDSMDVTYAA